MMSFLWGICKQCSPKSGVTSVIILFAYRKKIAMKKKHHVREIEINKDETVNSSGSRKTRK